MSGPEMRLLHIAGMADRHTLATFAHAAKVIERLGVAQCLIALDEGRGAEVRFVAPAGLDVRAVNCEHLSVFGRIRALQLELAGRVEKVYAVHLHGLSACLLGSQALVGTRVAARIVYSPHLGHAASPWTASLLGRFLQSRINAAQCAAVTASLAEAEVLSRLLKRSAEVLTHPVANAYFRVRRREAGRPNVLAEGTGQAAVDAVSRLSVLLNGREDRVRILWLGGAAAGPRRQLEAAGVAVLGLEGDEDRAEAFAHASAFVHVSPSHRLPIAVPQAMAAGVPCFVSETPPHRALVRHGETGFVCASERDLLEKLVLLLRDADERRRIGEAAHREAVVRFTWKHFERALLRAYGFSAGREREAARAPAPPARPTSDIERKVWESLGN
jgi:hypothetical protein